MTHAIEILELTRTFGTLRAVDGLSMTVERGTFFGFLGPNGAGKSTTIHMLTGLLKVTSGSATLLGYDIVKDPVEVKRRIGVVPEELALFDRLTGREYLTFVGRMYGMDSKQIQSRGEELLDLMELAGDQSKLIVDYSHGMKKKLALSAALIHEPELLFLDEPFEGIDAIASRMIKQILGILIGRGVTIFLTSHILEIVERLCTDVAIIHRGKLVAQGSMETLRQGVELEGDPSVKGTRTLEEIFLTIIGTGDRPERTLSWLE
ncbi:MAG TPA: ABC transporter ATP-binding protein [Thermoanaerobaculia bacterium]|nr:ABC transporter ATP-binding protein [Thermoanaerobaculia bacterium]HUM30616.1 ABC transporter ATP-binding protein [Thermoanaerobaculia bacterium]HXK68856.1 ABC transporter ATP-binding protein [Thermoanaerobaculia bacterium]